MSVHERICLVIDEHILICQHRSGWNFVGGKVENINNPQSSTALRELEEELGITFKIPPKITLISISKKYEGHSLLYYANIKKEDLVFGKASHVWEIRGFTLIPLDKNLNSNELGEWFQNQIRNANPYTPVFAFTRNREIIPLEKIPDNLPEKFISELEGIHYIRLNYTNPLTQEDRGLLKKINFFITGYEDEEFLYDDNHVSNIKYLEYDINMHFDISTNMIYNIGSSQYVLTITYNNLFRFNKTHLKPVGILDNRVKYAIQNHQQNLESKLHNFGLNEPDNNMKYYYIDNGCYCCSLDIDVMYNDISFGDYLEPIKRLAEYYKNSVPNYYQELYERNKERNINSPVYINQFDDDLDEILMQYIKCRRGASCLIAWGINKIENIEQTEFYQELVKNGSIIGLKEMKLNKKQLLCTIYQVYYNIRQFKSLEAIKGKSNKSNKDNDKIYVIFYLANDVHSLSGKDAPLKTKLRQILMKADPNSQNNKPNFYLHVTDNLSETINLAQLFCNKNSMELLKYQRLDRIMNLDFSRSQTLFMTLKYWMYSLIKPVDWNRFMVFSSACLFSLGLRNMNDMDLLVHYLPEESRTKTRKFFEQINRYLEDERSRFSFLVDGVSIKGHNEWCINCAKSYLVDWFEKEWPELIGARSMDEIILNPKYHYYYFGMKLVSLDADIARRNHRNRPAAFADLFALQKFAFPDLKILPIPEGYWKNHVYYKFNEKEIKELLDKTLYYLNNRYKITMNIEDIKKVLVGKV